MRDEGLDSASNRVHTRSKGVPEVENDVFGEFLDFAVVASAVLFEDLLDLEGW